MCKSQISNVVEMAYVQDDRETPVVADTSPPRGRAPLMPMFVVGSRDLPNACRLPTSLPGATLGSRLFSALVSSWMRVSSLSVRSSPGRLRLAVGHHQVLDRERRPEVLLLDEPSVDNLPLLIWVFEPDLQPGGFSKRDDRTCGSGELTSNRRSKLGTTL